MKAEILERVKSATCTLGCLRKWFLGKKELSVKAKMSVYRAVYLPRLTYACDSWVLDASLKSKVQAAEMRFLRLVAHKSRLDCVRSTVIRESLEQESLCSLLQRRQLQWYGHVKRGSAGQLYKDVLELDVEGKRGPGRPRKTWLKMIDEHVKKKEKPSRKEVEEEGLYEDRLAWRRDFVCHPPRSQLRFASFS